MKRIFSILLFSLFLLCCGCGDTAKGSVAPAAEGDDENRTDKRTAFAKHFEMIENLTLREWLESGQSILIAEVTEVQDASPSSWRDWMYEDQYLSGAAPFDIWDFEEIGICADVSIDPYNGWTDGKITFYHQTGFTSQNTKAQLQTPWNDFPLPQPKERLLIFWGTHLGPESSRLWGFYTHPAQIPIVADRHGNMACCDKYKRWWFPPADS